MEAKRIHFELTKLLKNSYCPYSKFKVACIVMDEKGNLHNGVNVENASYGATICAERSAISNMISNGGREIKNLYLMTDTEDFIPPCGMCLQVISEFMNPSSSIYLFSNNNRYKHWLLENLLPTSFTKKTLTGENNE